MSDIEHWGSAQDRQDLDNWITREPDDEEEPEVVVADWNAKCPVGTAVLYWPMLRAGAGRRGHSRSSAVLLNDTPVVWVTGHAGAIALTHVQAVDDA